MILVTGATGNVGSHVLSQLAAAGQPVRALVRSREKADDLRGLDCEIAIGSYEEPAALAEAVRGVDAVFLLTQPGPQQPVQEAALLDVLPAGARVVKLAALGVDDPDPAVRLVRSHRDCVAQLRARGVPHTVLAPNGFLQNLLRQASAVQGQDAVYASIGDAAVSFVDCRDVAAVAAHVLTTEGHEGATYPVTGPAAVTYAEIAERLSELVGRPVRAVDVPPEQARDQLVGAGVPAWLADGLAELDASYWAGAGAVVTDEVAKAGGTPRTLGDFLADHAAAFRS